MYEEDEEWLLVKADGEDGLVGYVPGNYVDQVSRRRVQLVHFIDSFN